MMSLVCANCERQHAAPLQSRAGAGNPLADTCGFAIRRLDTISVARQLHNKFLAFCGIPTFIRGSQETAIYPHPERHLRLSSRWSLSLKCPDQNSVHE